MKRVVITGLGIISSIGNNQKQVLNSLKDIKSGIVFSKEMKEFGLKSHVWGSIKLNKIPKIHRSKLKFMNISSVYSYLVMDQAIKDSHLTQDIYQNNSRVGVISGIGCNFFNTGLNIKNRDINPFFLIQTMFSNISACLSTFYHLSGISSSISSACATSSSCIYHAYELIKNNQQDIIFTGGAEELSCELAYRFDGINALSIKFNDFPDRSSRPFDINRDGFVISGGSGLLVIEELHHALNRNAKIYCEIVGCSTLSDGFNMVQPSGIGLIHSMKNSLIQSKNICIDYINAHGTSTQIGDLVELKSIKKVFRNSFPYISSTKSITGHSLGASGVQEIIYTILMMHNNFIFPNINIDHLENIAQNMNLITYKNQLKISTAMSNNCGFGGVNVSIIITKYDG